MRGLTIALTGGLPGISRAGLKVMLRESGAVYTAHLDAQTDLLVVGSAPLPSKVAEAERLGIRTRSGVDFLADLIGEETEVPVADAPRVACVQVEQSQVRILDLTLSRRAVQPLTPSIETLRGYTLDAPTVRVLRGLTRAVQLRHPCLLTGDTATSKTSAIRFLAALTGAQVVRLNLNGQTDTGELVGRYVPDGAGWRFAEGLVPQAMRHGWWVVLDEVNLAEPAVLERLNPVLERVPSLVLTEGPGTRFGPGGVAVHAEFRVFATRNPPRYAGRTALSPAWIDRFTAQLIAQAPAEAELLQLLEHLSSGHQPEIELDGVSWSAGPSWGTAEEALVPLSASWPAVAAFFAGLSTMGLGAGAQEAPVFTRRTLLAVVDAVLGLVRTDPVRGQLDVHSAPREMLAEAVRAVTVERLADPEDCQRVTDWLATCGL